MNALMKLFGVMSFALTASSPAADKTLIDYFLPMPIQSPLVWNVCGAPGVFPRDPQNGLEDTTMKQWCYWDGQIIKGPEGKYHLFASRWDQSKGHGGWWGSLAVHAVSDKVAGPYADKGLCWPDNQGGKGHNVTALVLPDGRYAVVVSETRPGDVFVSKSLDGPWEQLGSIQVATNEFSRLGRMSNVSIMVRADGDFMIVARSGAIWISKDGILGPYTVQGPSVYPQVKGLPLRNLEDPVIWHSGGLYHIVVNGWSDRKAYHITSPDGIKNWTFRGLAYDPTKDFLRYTDGTVNHWDKIERPGVLMENGHVTHFTFAVLDVPKDQERGNDTHGSKIIVVPFDGAAFDRDMQNPSKAIAIKANAAGETSAPVALSKIAIAPGPFQPTWESLKQYECPEWFRDAKFGIWSHWGPQCVPEQGDWYARYMYQEGSRQYQYHVATYGHPSEFGYKDIVKLWKAEKFDPDRLMAKYVKAGAKYFVSMGVHHDNFDLWDSKYHKWNAVNMGPKRDIVGAWAAAARKHGLRFGVSEHLARTYSWFNFNKRADKKGDRAGVPYDGNDPQYVDFYLPPHDDSWQVYPTNPPAWWQQHWYDRMTDLVDKYQPDLVYTDGGVPFGEVGRALMAHYYNRNLAWHGGKLEAVYNIKDDPRKEHGEYVEGIAVEDQERAALPGIKAAPWQTCSSVADWFYSRNHRFKTTTEVIHMLADIVSKNGNLLLNFTQRADGTLDAESETILDELAGWMPINEEAIFGTRPWRIFGEGPSASASGRIVEGRTKYAAADIRFTTKGDALYAIVLGWPEDRTVRIKSLAEGAEPARIAGVQLLGDTPGIKFNRDAEGLKVQLPEKAPCRHAIVLKVIPE